MLVKDLKWRKSCLKMRLLMYINNYMNAPISEKCFKDMKIRLLRSRVKKDILSGKGRFYLKVNEAIASGPLLSER